MEVDKKLLKCKGCRGRLFWFNQEIELRTDGKKYTFSQALCEPCGVLYRVKKPKVAELNEK